MFFLFVFWRAVILLAHIFHISPKRSDWLKVEERLKKI